MSDAPKPAPLTTIDQIIPQPRVVTIGTFDGVHRGHQSLIAAARARATELGFTAIAITFEPVPVMVLRPDAFRGRVSSVDEKLNLLCGLGLEAVVTIPFDRELAKKSPESFMTWIVESTGLTELWVGEAFALGKDRVGDVNRLTEIGRELGFSVVAVQRLTDGGEIISSSSIRQAILDGDVERAGRFLGRPYRMSGEVIHGAHLGRTIGYPTANVAPPPHLAVPADGIYASVTRIGDDAHAFESMTYIGTRPTVNSGERLAETHLLDFNRDLYGQTIHVDLLTRLRGDAVFTGVEALIEQLKIDEREARRFLRQRGTEGR